MIVVVSLVTALCAVACDDSPPTGNTAPSTALSTVAPSPSTKTTKPVRRVRPPKVPAGMTAGYMVYDRRGARIALQYNAQHRFRSASVVKILIALDYLSSHRSRTAIPAGDQALLRTMLRSSNDQAATALWRRGGQVRIIQRMTATLGLRDSGPPPAGKPGFWGYTAISAADIVRVYRYLLTHRRYGDVILGHLRRATQCGADGFDQYFGIPAALRRPWAIKQGWSGYGSVPPVPCVRSGTADYRPATVRAPAVDLAHPVLHTTGTVGPGDRWIVVVLSLNTAGSPWRTATARLTALTKAVYRAGTMGS
jgi:hypothetical protein